MAGFDEQIPRYIITLHEILAHTPYEHVERRSLENARVQLETLSRQMHDEVQPFTAFGAVQLTDLNIL
jgi:hypothetical protein